MLHFLTGSSERTPSLPSPPSIKDIEAVAARSASDPVAADEPLPEIRRGDYARLLVQAPQRLYLYWSFAHDPFTILSRMSGEASRDYTLALRLVDVESNAETLSLISRQATSAWLDAQAGRRLRADVGLFAAGRPFIKILSSNVVQMPRAGVSPQVDATTEFRVSPADFTRALSEAGYVDNAIEVWLEAADEATEARATRHIAGRIAELPFDDAENLRQLRHLIGSLAAGIPPERLRAGLSPQLARWIEEAQVRAGDAALDPARLLDVLGSVFDFSLEYESLDETFGDWGRRAAMAWAGSDVRLPSNLFHLWLPSMTASVASRLASL